MTPWSSTAVPGAIVSLWTSWMWRPAGLSTEPSGLLLVSRQAMREDSASKTPTTEAVRIEVLQCVMYVQVALCPRSTLLYSQKAAQEMQRGSHERVKCSASGDVALAMRSRLIAHRCRSREAVNRTDEPREMAEAQGGWRALARGADVPSWRRSSEAASPQGHAPHRRDTRR
jgi:hypothetical protein